MSSSLIFKWWLPWNSELLYFFPPRKLSKLLKKLRVYYILSWAKCGLRDLHIIAFCFYIYIFHNIPMVSEQEIYWNPLKCVKKIKPHTGLFLLLCSSKTCRISRMASWLNAFPNDLNWDHYLCFNFITSQLLTYAQISVMRWDGAENYLWASALEYISSDTWHQAL